VDFLSANLIGSAAGTLTTLAFVPQVLKAWKTQSVEDLSVWMLVTFTTGVALWVLYGVKTHALPLVVTNGATLLLALMLLGMKLRSRD
jgi:MtN3 and saliva related transmembrane protein